MRRAKRRGGATTRRAWLPAAVRLLTTAQLLAIGYELAEWHTFIRHGTNDDPPYEDTLGDLALGVLGALGAAVLVARSSNRDRPAPSAAD